MMPLSDVEKIKSDHSQQIKKLNQKIEDMNNKMNTMVPG